MADQKVSLSRRSFIGGSTALALGAIGAPKSAIAADACGATTVGTWGGDYRNLLDQHVGAILRAGGANAVYAVGDQLQRATRLRAEKSARRGSMDVVLLNDIDMYEMSEAGLLQNLDPATIRNGNAIYPNFRKAYSVPHIFSAMVIAYNPSMVPSAPQSMTDFLDKRFEGRFGFATAVYSATLLSAALAGGGDSENLEPGYRLMRELKGNKPKVYPSNEDLAAALKSGEIWAACIWKARALQWSRMGLPLAYAFPREGAVPVVFEAAVPANAPSKDCARDFLGALLDPAAQAAFAETMGYAPSTQNATLSGALQSAVGFTPDEVGRMMKMNSAALIRQKQALLDFWNKDFTVGL